MISFWILELSVGLVQAIYDNYSHVNSLDSVNLKQRILLEKYVLINFYASKCDQCIEFVPTFSLVSRMLFGIRTDVYIGSLNCFENAQIMREYDIPNIPSVKLFQKTQSYDFRSVGSTFKFSQWVFERIGEEFVIVEQLDILKELIETELYIAVGFFKNISGQNCKTFQNVAKSVEKLPWIIVTNGTLFNDYSVKLDDHIAMFRQFDEARIDFSANFTENNVNEFITKYSSPLLSEFHNRKMKIPEVFDTTNLNYLISIIDEKHKKFTLHKMMLQKAAKLFLGKVKFVYVNVENPAAHYLLTVLRLKKEEIPTYRYMLLFSDYRTVIYKPADDKMTSKKIVTFVQNVIDGNLPPYYRSEKLHQRWNKYPVKMLVASNYDEVTKDQNRSVFVLLCAEKCKQCLNIRHLWHNLAVKFENHPDVWIAAIDVDKNDIKESRIEKFPTFYLYLKGSKEAIEYDGERTLNGLKLFIDSNGTLPLPNNVTEPEEKLTKRLPSYISNMNSVEEMPRKDFRLLIEEI